MTHQESLSILMEAHELRDELSPSVDTRAYLAVIGSHDKENDSHGASIALKLAAEAGQDDERCWEATLQAMCRSNRPENAMDLLRDMRKANLKPSLEGYNAVISSFEKSKRVRASEYSKCSTIDFWIVSLSLDL